MPDTPKITPGKLEYGSRRSRLDVIKDKLSFRRRSHAVGLKVASSLATMVPAYKQRMLKAGSCDMLANGRPPFVNSISLIRAARDGLLDVVESHIIMRTGCVYDTDEDGFNSLHVAARYNRADVIKLLLDNFPKADINVKGGSDEQRPLHVACRYNSESALQCLLAQGAEINVKDSKGRTPLHYATRRGHDTICKMLMSVTSCNVNASDHDKTTPLHMAAIQGKASICELLISRGALIMDRDINDVTALMWAATEGHLGCIEVLIKAASKYGSGERAFVQAHDNEGNTALHMAVQNGQLETCKLLLDHFADINVQRHNRMTPLHLAAVAGNEEIAMLLISRGADVNRPDCDNMTPVHRAALYNKVDIIKLLVKHGANLNAKDKKNKSPLHCACWKGQTDTVLYLIENGAQVAEVDTGLMTALHWTVQFGHYNTLLALLKHSGHNLIEATDKNDQTVLHYAAHSGNVLVLKTLLDHGAKPDAKDADERTPLHIAALCDNVHCVEALIHASSHETSDDDVDGRTPLLLASAHGHHMVVQVLLSLGADISNRDDEHRTSLMVAAASGHIMVMRILLDNHVPVNETDKLKSSALHYACAGGYVEAVQMLLDKRADVTLKNAYDQSPLDQAIDNLHNDVAIAMLKHKSWRDCMTVRDGQGMNPMDRLVARLPDAALIVLDHCVERSCRDDEDMNLTMTFDYQYIDPGPDDPSSEKRRYLALNGMVEHERDALLSHPLCQTVLYQKWVRFGRSTFYINLVIYIGYLFSLTYYTAVVGEALSEVVLDSTYFCPIFLNKTTRDNSTWRENIKKTADPHRDLSVKEQDVKVMSGWVLVFILLFFLREAFKILQRGFKYFLNVFNLIALILVATTFAFIYPYGYYPCLVQWRAGWLALFLAWINFIMYLRRIDFVGIYVIMFVTVLSSLLKAVLLYIFFCWAFAGSFYALMYTQEYYGNDDKKVFGNIGTAVLNIFVMTLGEIEFVDNFVEPDLGPFKGDVYFLLVIFLFLMPLVLMNLMIGIAVGDIEKIQRNAYLKRIALQVDLLFNFENTMPRWLQRRAYVRRAVIKPNEDNTYCWHKIKRTALGGGSSGTQFIHKEQKDKVEERIEYMERQYRLQQNRMRSMQAVQQQELAILQQIASRLKLDNLGGVLESSSNIMNPDQLSMYDNMTLGAPASPLMVRVNSTRSEHV